MTLVEYIVTYDKNLDIVNKESLKSWEEFWI